MDIDQIRRQKKNELLLSLKECNNKLERYNDAIKNLKSSKFDNGYVETQIKKKEEYIKECKEKVHIINNTISSINSGKLDDELISTLNSTKQIIENKTILTKNKKEEKRKSIAASRSISERYRSDMIADSRHHRRQTRNLSYEYRKYVRNVDSLPAYMKRNLKDMPGHKGYRYKGIIFFGELPYDSRNNTVIFEKRKGLMIIEEWADNEIRIYEKIGKERRKLVSRNTRRRSTTDCNLMDYLVKKRK